MSAPERLSRARKELERARRDANAADTDAALQHACQSLEAALKSVIAHEGKSVPTGNRSHDHTHLQELADTDFSAHSPVIDTLSGVYVQARYPDTPPHEIRDVDPLLTDVAAVVSDAEDTIEGGEP